MTALVRGVIRFSTAAGERVKVSSVMSANMGTALFTTTAVAVAVIVQGVVMTSSPGPTPAAPTAAISPLVAEFTLTACRTPKYSAHSFSKL